MKIAALPAKEAERLQALRETGILDTQPEAEFDDVAALAATICATPIALISLVDRARQWFKARVGLAAIETPRDISFCAHAIHGSDLMIVADAAGDERFFDNPLVTARPPMQFYAGMPLVTSDGHALGTLCVIDAVPRSLTEAQKTALRILGRQVSIQLELRRATRELAISKAEYEDLIENSAVLLQNVALDGRIVYVNELWRRTLGYPGEERPQESFWNLVAPECREQVRLAFERASRHARHQEIEADLLARDGRRVAVRGTLSPGRRPAPCVIGILREVTHLRELEIERDGFFSLSLDLLCIADTEGRFRRLNPAWTQTLGYSLEELLGRPYLDFVHEEDRAATRAEAQHLSVGGTTRRFENRYRTRDGSYRRLLWSAVASPDRQRIFAAARDITAIRRQQEELQHKSNALEEATLAAHTASRVKSEFLANMSHEIRTPLNGILGFARLLHDGEVGRMDDAQRECLGHVLTSAGHLLQLINDILDLSKVEAGKLEFHPVDIDLAKTVAEVCEIVRTAAARKRIGLTIEVADGLGPVRLDPARLKQVLYNFLSNAIKFTPEEGRVTIRATAEGADRIRLAVEDTGIGIEAADLDRLFREFQQLRQGPDKRHPGTGLGLALTKRLVEGQGGEVGVDSRPGQGSTFFAVLPSRHEAPPAPEAEPAQGAPPEEDAGESPLSRDQAHILVIEDDPKERAWLRRVLGEAGFAVSTAATGEEAIRTVRAQPFDAITLDLHLGETSGREVLEAVRASDENRQVPVIVVSALADPHLSVGRRIDDFLPKSAAPKEVVAALERAGVAPGAAAPVLVVDGDGDAAQRLAAALEIRGIRSVTATSETLARKVIRERAPAAIVLDPAPQGTGGPELLRDLRRTTAGARTPVVVWSSGRIPPGAQARLQASAQAMVRKGAGAGAALLQEIRFHLGAKHGR